MPRTEWLIEYSNSLHNHNSASQHSFEPNQCLHRLEVLRANRSKMSDKAKAEAGQANYLGDESSQEVYPEDSFGEKQRRNANAKLVNPLVSFSVEQLGEKGVDYAWDHGLSHPDDRRAFEIGAILAQDPANLKRIRGMVSEEEMAELRREWQRAGGEAFDAWGRICLSVPIEG